MSTLTCTKRCRLLGTKNLTGMALGGLDMALWDAWARACGRAACARARCRRSADQGLQQRGPLRCAFAWSKIAEETRVAGYAGLKIKVGFPTLAEDLAAVRAAREDARRRHCADDRLQPVARRGRGDAYAAGPLDGEGLDMDRGTGARRRFRGMRAHRRRGSHADPDRRELQRSFARCGPPSRQGHPIA